MSAVVSVGFAGTISSSVTCVATLTSIVAVRCAASVARSVTVATVGPAVNTPVEDTVQPLAGLAMLHAADTAASLNVAVNCVLASGATRAGPVTRNPLPCGTVIVAIADLVLSATLVART